MDGFWCGPCSFSPGLSTHDVLPCPGPVRVQDASPSVLACYQRLPPPMFGSRMPAHLCLHAINGSSPNAYCREFFPATGDVTDAGFKEGSGYTMNIAWQVRWCKRGAGGPWLGVSALNVSIVSLAYLALNQGGHQMHVHVWDAGLCSAQRCKSQGFTFKSTLYSVFM